MIGSTIGGYELTEKLGSNLVSTTYKARVTATDMPAIVKILLPQVVGNEIDLERFKTKAGNAMHLDHPDIVKVIDAGQKGTDWFVAMEYVEGYSVEDWILRSGKIVEDQALMVIQHAAVALAYAWDDCGITHRDLKPSDIMIAADGSVKVTDLGMIKLIETDAGRMMTSEIGITPYYCSPEVAKGERKPGFRSDLYSLGAILYHMVTGKVPFGDAGGAGALVKQVTDKLQNPRELNPDLSDHTIELISHMMAKAPEHRHKSWTMLVDDIKGICRGEKPESLPAKAASSVSLPSRNHDKGKAKIQAKLVVGPKKKIARGAMDVLRTTQMLESDMKPARRSYGGLIAVASLLLVLVGSVAFGIHFLKKQQRDAAMYRADLERQAEEARRIQEQELVSGGLEADASFSNEPEPADTEALPARVAATPRSPRIPYLEAPRQVTNPEPEPEQPATTTPAVKPEPGQPQDERLPDEFIEARTQFEQQQRQTDVQYTINIKKVNKQYLGALEKLRQAVQKQGELEQVMAIKSEEARFKQEETVPFTASADLPMKVREFQATFSKLERQYQRDRTAKKKSAAVTYLRDLAILKKLLTQKKRIEDAILVDKQMKAFTMP